MKDIFADKPFVFFVPSIVELSKILGIDKNSVKKEGDLNLVYYRGIPFIFLGVSKSNAAYVSTLFFTQYSFQKAFLIGIAGAYPESDLKLSDIVSVKYDYFVDESYVYDDYSIKFLCEDGFDITDNNRGEFTPFEGLRVADSNTVSVLPQFDALSHSYHLKTGAIVENMEGAAFALVANKFGIYPYHIRSISNFCGAKSAAGWDIKGSCRVLREFIDNMIDSI